MGAVCTAAAVGLVGVLLNKALADQDTIRHSLDAAAGVTSYADLHPLIVTGLAGPAIVGVAVGIALLLAIAPGGWGRTAGRAFGWSLAVAAVTCLVTVGDYRHEAFLSGHDVVTAVMVGLLAGAGSAQRDLARHPQRV